MMEVEGPGESDADGEGGGLPSEYLQDRQLLDIQLVAVI